MKSKTKKILTGTVALGGVITAANAVEQHAYAASTADNSQLCASCPANETS